MSNMHDFDWLFDRDYCGRILQNDYSHELKQRVAESILLFRNFNVSANPSMPYISAWQEGSDHSIWYEFAGNRLLDLLGCRSCEVAEIFRDSIIKQCTFHYQTGSEKISRKILQQQDLASHRYRLRQDVKNNGCTEAIYKVSLPDKGSIWLKDVATVESFPADNVCLSFGALIDVTKEMVLEEQRQIEEESLRLQHQELEKKLEEQNKELWKVQLDMIYRLAQATSIRDNHTGLHITKMSHYCDILSQAAGLADETRELLFHATAMHDVGKIGISETILQKPGKLSDQEFEIMKTHSIIGAKLLSGNDSPLLKMAKSVALNHHERWDGTGYPNGISHEEIPLTGRIAAICDVFDALTSDRPYKKAWDIDKALSQITREKGTKFDPKLVDLFVDQRESIEEIRNQTPLPAGIQIS